MYFVNVHFFNINGYIIEIISIFCTKKLNVFTLEAFCENADLVTRVPQEFEDHWVEDDHFRPYGPAALKARRFVFTFQYTVMVWRFETVTLRVRPTSNILWRCAGVPSHVSLFLDFSVEGSTVLKTATL